MRVKEEKETLFSSSIPACASMKVEERVEEDVDVNAISEMLTIPVVELMDRKGESEVSMVTSAKEESYIALTSSGSLISVVNVSAVKVPVVKDTVVRQVREARNTL